MECTSTDCTWTVPGGRPRMTPWSTKSSASSTSPCPSSTSSPPKTTHLSMWSIVAPAIRHRIEQVCSPRQDRVPTSSCRWTSIPKIILLISGRSEERPFCASSTTDRFYPIVNIINSISYYTDFLRQVMIGSISWHNLMIAIQYLTTYYIYILLMMLADVLVAC